MIIKLNCKSSRFQLVEKNIQKLQDFKDFVQSVFIETNKELRKISTASTPQKKTPTTPSTHFVDVGIDRRAEHIFSV